YIARDASAPRQGSTTRVADRRPALAHEAARPNSGALRGCFRACQLRRIIESGPPVRRTAVRQCRAGQLTPLSRIHLSGNAWHNDDGHALHRSTEVVALRTDLLSL